MSAPSISQTKPPAEAAAAASLSESPIVRALIIGVSAGFVVLFVCAPLLLVFVKAFERGPAAFLEAVTEPDAVAAIQLTLLTAAVAVPVNIVFGLSAAWLIGKFSFRGRQLLTTCIDMPFTVSPVISGMAFVLIFGLQGWLGPWLQARDIAIVFAMPGIVLCTVFVTFPFVAREVIPMMQASGTEEEEAATVLGAGGWTTFLRVSLPNVKWAVIYGIILCTARSMGEFGAVSVVSGHIRGETNTIPLHAEILYNEYRMSEAFAVASLLTVLAVVTLVVKKVSEIRIRKDMSTLTTSRESA